MAGKQMIRDLVLAAAVVAVIGQGAWGATVTWTSPTTGGSWEATPSPWSSGYPLAGDTAALGDVISGTRVVTVDAAETINQLSMTQTTAGAVNTLQLNNSLTLGSTPFALTPTAGVNSLVLDLNGQSLTSTTSDNNTVNLGGTVNMGAASVLTMLNTNGQGNMRVANAGNLSMDGSLMVWQWDALGNNNGTRNFSNTGDWTLQNAASISFISTVGRPIGGFGNMATNSNAGTFNILSNSAVASAGFTNTGTLQMGEGAALGGTAVTSFNGVWLANNGGTVNVTGNARFGDATGSQNVSTAILTNGASGNGANFNIGDGSNALTLTFQGTNVAWVNNAGNTTTVASGAALKMIALANADGNNYVAHSTQMTNAGILGLAGKIQFQPNHVGSPVTFSNNSLTNTGIVKVTGASAVIERLAGPRSGFYLVADATTGGNNTILHNNAGGVLQGASASDTLTYTNSTGSPLMKALAIKNAGGTIAPGNGTGGTALSSVGALRFTNANINFDATSGGLLAMDLGGNSASGNFDTLTLDAGAGVTGVGAFNLAGGTLAVLDITTVDGYIPTGGTYVLANYLSQTGTFGTLKLNGQATADYTVDYGVSALSITFVPEPATAGLLAGAVSLFSLSRRRRRA